MPGPFRISILFRKECESWVAQCLEFDVCGAGASIDDAEYELQRMLIGHATLNLAASREPFAGLHPAPDMYFAEFGKAAALKDRPTPVFSAPHPLPAFSPELRVV